MIVQPFPSFFHLVLWLLLTSCSSLLLRGFFFSSSARPPRVSVTTFASYICCIYTLKFGQYGTLFWLGNSSVSKSLLYSFCSSDRGFAVGFLQTPPHDGRPCLWLTVPTAKSVADFHRQVVTRAERTIQSAMSKNEHRAFFIRFSRITDYT